MKKFNIFIFAIITAALFLVGCSSDNNNNNNANEGNNNGGNAKQEKLILGHAGPGSEDNHHQQFALEFKKLVEERTDGEVEVEIHPNGELGGERDLIEGVQLGTIDISITANGPLGNFVEQTNAFDMPFLFEDMDHVNRVFDGEIGQEISDELKDDGFEVLVWADNGFRYILNDIRPIKDPEDMEGIKMRAVESEIYLDTYKALGGVPTSMAHDELYTSLQQGVVEGMDGPITWFVPGKFIEVQKYISDAKLFYSPAPILMNEAKFSGFSDETREIISQSAKDAKEHQGDFIIEMTEKLTQEAIDEGNEFVTEEEFDTEGFKERVQPVYDKYMDKYGDLIEAIQDEVE